MADSFQYGAVYVAFFSVPSAPSASSSYLWGWVALCCRRRSRCLCPVEVKWLQTVQSVKSYSKVADSEQSQSSTAAEAEAVTEAVAEHFDVSSHDFAMADVSWRTDWGGEEGNKTRSLNKRLLFWHIDDIVLYSKHIYTIYIHMYNILT